MTTEKGADRQVYQKPQLTEVELVVEEAVLAACKTATSTGSKDVACQKTSGQGGPCNQQLS